MLFDYSPSSKVRFIRLTDYCVVEFILEPLASSIFTTIAYSRIVNTFNNTNQIFNIDSALHETGNVQDLSVVNTANSIAAYLDSEKTPTYAQYDPTLTQTTLASQTVVTDTIKFHFMAGFDFQDLAAVILTVKAQMNDGNFLILSNLLLSPLTFDTILRFSAKPLFLNGTVYDRFVIIKVPSVKNLNNDYYNSTNRSATFAYRATGGIGIVKDIPITLALSESSYHKTINGTNLIDYDGYEVSQYLESKVAQINDLDDLGAFIGEATDGDYIEYFATFNGGFPDEIITILNQRGSDQSWDIIHQLTVFEQVGSSFIQSGPYTIYQDSNFDAPLKFRPILDHAHEAITVSIDYLVRLYNKLTGDQEIRTGSVSITNPNKYGKQLSKIQLGSILSPNKIYNKIYQKSYDSTLLFIEPSNQGVIPVGSSAVTQPTVITKTEYVPMFFQYNNLTVAEKSSVIASVDNAHIIAFGQGKLPILVQPFDNIFKFKVYTTQNGAQVPFNLNMNSTVRLVFNSLQNSIGFNNMGDTTKENLSDGEVAFRISKDDSAKLLALQDRTFYLTIVGSDGTETSFYSGKWFVSTERDDVSALYQAEFDAIKVNGTVDTAIQAISDKLDVSNASVPVTGTQPLASVPIISAPGYISAGTNDSQISVIHQITPISDDQN